MREQSRHESPTSPTAAEPTTALWRALADARARCDVSLSDAASLATEDFAATPAAVVGGAQRAGDAGASYAFGWGKAGRLTASSTAPAVELDDIFDLASITKPFVAVLTARLEQMGSLRREETLDAFLPELADTPSGNVSLALLLSHRSGLSPHIELFAPLRDGGRFDRRAALRTAACARRPECAGPPPSPHGFLPAYCDLGYMLVGEALARRMGKPLDELLLRHVIQPLELPRLGSARQLAKTGCRFVPTEIVPYRTGLVEGAVHDDNAWALGGLAACGHAGLFGDVHSLVGFGVALLELGRGADPGFLTPERLESLVRARPDGSLAMGFDRKSGEGSSVGSRLGDATFGHLGFTGVSLWVDPVAQIVAVTLTNRVHPSRDHIAIRKARPAMHDHIVNTLLDASQTSAEPSLAVDAELPKKMEEQARAERKRVAQLKAEGAPIAEIQRARDRAGELEASIPRAEVAATDGLRVTRHRLFGSVSASGPRRERLEILRHALTDAATRAGVVLSASEDRYIVEEATDGFLVDARIEGDYAIPSRSRRQPAAASPAGTAVHPADTSTAPAQKPSKKSLKKAKGSTKGRQVLPSGKGRGDATSKGGRPRKSGKKKSRG